MGERVGDTIGLRVRFGSQVSKRTRIEVVTEGILTRLLQHDPSLAGYGLVIFDEFHERSLHADLGLALRAVAAERGHPPDLRALRGGADGEGAAGAEPGQPDAADLLGLVEVVHGREEVVEAHDLHPLDGGPTLNPSTYELLAGIHEVPAEEVVVLPNSPNVVMAAQHAAELSE